MRRANLPTAVGTLCLLLGLSACGGENLFPPYPITGVGTIAPAAVEGTVTAGTPLGGVSVILVGRDSTVTDGMGRFRFAGLAASTYTVALRVPLNHTLAPGDSATRRVQVGVGSVAQVSWELVAQGVGP